MYFTAYHTIIFYHVLPYASTHLNSPKFELYVEKFSYFLRDIRFAEYPTESGWNYCHLLRPYNYHVVGYLRTALMLASIPLFQGYPYGSISCLLAIQALEILRFLLTWPYQAGWRNIYRLLL